MAPFRDKNRRFVVVKNEPDAHAHAHAPAPPPPPLLAPPAHQTPDTSQPTQHKASLIVKLKVRAAQRPQPSKIVKLRIRPSNVVGVANPSNSEPRLKEIRARIEALERRNSESAREINTQPARPQTQAMLPPPTSPPRLRSSVRKDSEKRTTASGQQEKAKMRPEMTAPNVPTGRSSTAPHAAGRRSSKSLDVDFAPASNAPDVDTSVATNTPYAAPAIGRRAFNLQQSQQKQQHSIPTAPHTPAALAWNAPPARPVAGYGAFNLQQSEQQQYPVLAAPSKPASLPPTAPSVGPMAVQEAYKPQQQAQQQYNNNNNNNNNASQAQPGPTAPAYNPALDIPVIRKLLQMHEEQQHQAAATTGTPTPTTTTTTAPNNTSAAHARAHTHAHPKPPPTSGPSDPSYGQHNQHNHHHHEQPATAPQPESKANFLARFARINAAYEEKEKEQREWDERVEKGKREFYAKYPNADEELMRWRRQTRPKGWRYEE